MAQIESNFTGVHLINPYKVHTCFAPLNKFATKKKKKKINNLALLIRMATRAKIGDY